MSIQANFPAIKPTLLLDFANTEALDPRITFTRASTGTYYDGKTVAKAEENLQIQSQDFDNASWTKGNVTVAANSATAPDGTSTADTLDEGTATNYHNVTGRTAQVGTNTISVFAKNISAQYVILTLTNGSGTYCSAVYDTVAGTVANSAAAGSGFSISATSITSVGSGWYRCVMTCVIPFTGEFNIGLSNSTTIGSFGLSSYTGTSRQMYIWGAQLEQRAQATAYTPTTTQPVTNYIPVLLTAASGVPRFEHNPVTGESLGLEIEEQRTNLVTYSEQFDNAAWTKTNTTITANTTAAPDGTLTADKLVENTSSGLHQTRTAVGFTISGSYSTTVYAKAGERNFIYIATLDPATYRLTYFNLVTGTVATKDASHTASITPVGNGWYRCTVSYSFQAGVAYIYYGAAILDNSDTYTGNGFSGIYIWGAQLEAGAFPTSYIPTVASQVTRAADSAVMTGANFSSWYRPDEGTLYSEAAVASVASTTQQNIWSLFTDTSNNTRLWLWEGAPSTLRFSSFNSGAQQWDLITSGMSANTFFKNAGVYKTNDFAMSTNAGTVQTDTSGLIARGFTGINIGSQNGSVGFMNGTIRKIAYYPVRVTNAQLQALTS